MNTSVSTASFSIAAFWEGVRGLRGVGVEGEVWMEVEVEVCNRKGRRGWMSAGGAREGWGSECSRQKDS